MKPTLYYDPSCPVCEKTAKICSWFCGDALDISKEQFNKDVVYEDYDGFRFHGIYAVDALLFDFDYLFPYVPSKVLKIGAYGLYYISWLLRKTRYCKQCKLKE